MKDRVRLCVVDEVTPSHPNDRVREELPTRLEAAWFHFRAACFRVRRALTNLAVERPRRYAPMPAEIPAAEIAVSRSVLFANSGPAEFALQAGKVHNLRLAAREMNGVRIKAGEVFSFWSQVGRPTRRRGFVAGRELREGCIIPSIGGGLCQLSNALYDAALNARLEIVERHAHSRRVPGSMAAEGRDATVFWNYVDLRLRAPFDWRIDAELTESELIVRFHRLTPWEGILEEMESPTRDQGDEQEVESCETCGVTSCFRNPSATGLARSGITAWLVDAWQPEHDRYLREHRMPGDWLFTPLNSRRWKIGPYRWTSTGYARVVESAWFVAKRSWISRRLAAQGAARQRALLAMDEALAAIYARRIPPEANHLVVSQNLLPHLWRTGILGGRTFDVLMTRLPMAELESVLDRASRAHPESKTLADFRAAPEVVRAETEALARAQHWITPHRAIARLAGRRAVLTDWTLPSRKPRSSGNRAVFPASTLGRKGAYELREAVRELHCTVRLCGPVIEGTTFWDGIRIERAGEDWLEGAACVVLPAWVEHQPRRLLEAVAAGVPVIASDACGLDGVEGVMTVPTGDTEALRSVLAYLISPEPVLSSTGAAFDTARPGW